ncbi:MAG TPA: hypothetical protein VFB30_07950 [Spirochaetia bacterium]|nr:hypothetical protein [Spirochaetia bacterium]
MSSRSFRRRNSRRRHRPPAAEAGGPQSPGQPGERAPQEKELPGARRGGPRRDSSQSLQGRNAPGRAADHRPARPPQPALPAPDCPICGKPVRELASALTHRISHQPAHFDCIVRELRDSTEIAPQEKLCYLGAGTFGILEFRPPGGPSKFVIKKRIQYEEKEIPQEWKKLLQIVC